MLFFARNLFANTIYRDLFLEQIYFKLKVVIPFIPLHGPGLWTATGPPATLLAASANGYVWYVI